MEITNIKFKLHTIRSDISDIVTELKYKFKQ